MPSEVLLRPLVVQLGHQHGPALLQLSQQASPLHARVVKAQGHRAEPFFDEQVELLVSAQIEGAAYLNRVSFLK